VSHGDVDAGQGLEPAEANGEAARHEAHASSILEEGAACRFLPWPRARRV
jgi:hypothetical protein